MLPRTKTLSLTRQEALSFSLSRSRTHTQSKYNAVIRTKGNLFEYPAPEDRFPFVGGSQLSKGDLHAHGMNFLYFLLKQNILSISEAKYNRLLNIYYKHRFAFTDHELELTWAEIEEFERIILSASINEELLARIHKNDPKVLTTLLDIVGDETSDRGLNDILILFILKKLHESGIPYVIELSNHGISFLHAYENGFIDFTPHGLKDISQAASLIRLGSLVGAGYTSRDKLIDYVEKYYIPHLVPFTYNYDEITDTLTISSHACTSWGTIQRLAKEFGVSTEVTCNKELAACLDEINRKFNILKRKKCVTQVYQNTALYDLIWKEAYTSDDLPIGLPAGCTNVNFIHGHSSKDKDERKKYPNTTNLDSLLAKSDLHFMGLYSVYYQGPKSLNHVVNEEILPDDYEPYNDFVTRVNEFKQTPEYNRFEKDCERKVSCQVKGYGAHLNDDERAEKRVHERLMLINHIILEVRNKIFDLRKLEETDKGLLDIERLRKGYSLVKLQLYKLVAYAEGKVDNLDDLWFLLLLADSQSLKYEKILAKKADNAQFDVNKSDLSETKMQLETKLETVAKARELEEYCEQVKSYLASFESKVKIYNQYRVDADQANSDGKQVEMIRLLRLAASELNSICDQLVHLQRILSLAHKLRDKSQESLKEIKYAEEKYKIYTDLKCKLKDILVVPAKSIINSPQRNEIRSKLQAYVDRVKSHKHRDGTINFEHNFYFFAKSRAANRRASYELALELLKDLDDPDANIASVFANANTRRNMLFTDRQYKNRGINSKPLKAVINMAIAPSAKVP